MMKVLIVNTSERTGGAAVAANRLKDALNNNGIEANMLVRDKLSDDTTVFTIKMGGAHNGTSCGNDGAYSGTCTFLSAISLLSTLPMQVPT